MSSAVPRPRWLPRYAALALALALAPSAGCQVSTGNADEKGDKSDKGDKKDGDESDQETPDRRVLVDSYTVVRGDVASHLVTTGSLESEAQADIVPETNGVVTQILVEEGDPVKRGQLLAVLSNPTLEAGATRAKLELSQAARDVETARSLHTRGAISDQELRTAEQTYKTAQTSDQEASRTRGFTRITSPIEGTVSVRDVRLGEVAGGGRTFQIVDLDRLRVVVQLPEKDLAQVHEGQSVVLQGAYDEDTQGTGTVARVSPVVDPQSGTVRVTVAVDPTTTSLRPGQFVKVRIEVDRHKDVLTIPRRALVWIDGDPVAWTVVDAKPDEEDADKKDDKDNKDDKDQGADDEPGFFAKLINKAKDAAADADANADADKDKKDEPPPWPLREAERADLEVGYQDPVLVEVDSGLTEGDIVVTVGNQNLRNGTPIRLPEDPGPEAARKDADAEDADGKDADSKDADSKDAG
ncbi:MAG: efflux RND transporter periplasmic adaptor subunit [Oligoflexia bacterium]|nr:efflux RND transporter periplasmic adaptor subunit [Oligoflexia bacterium]